MRTSEALNNELDNYINPEIEARLKDLEWIVDANLLRQYEDRVAQILKDNPWYEPVVLAETGKLSISAQIYQENYKRQFRWIMEMAANDDFESSQVA